MKKLFTLFALLTCFMGAKAEEVVDVEYDFSTVTAETWQHGWVDADNAAPYLSIEDGCLHFHNDEAKSARYEIQFQPFPSVTSLDNDAFYTITIKIKGNGNVANIGGYFSGSNNPGDIPVASDWQTLTFEGCQNNPDAQYFANSGSILVQCGDFVGDWWISYVKISHEEKAPSRPVEWRELLSNGDAETPWTEDQKSIRFDDNEKNSTICAWSKEKGHNMNDDGGWDPFVANIEEVDGSNVFVCHGQPADTEGDASAWDNQFWIESTKQMKVGSEYQIKFRYKASEDATTDTQLHHQTPSSYVFHGILGQIKFTTEWQTYEGKITIPDNAPDAWSIAFNLNSQNKNAVDFYFDDLSISEMVLDEGWFVASSNKVTGMEYDYDNAIEFVQDPDDPEVVVATVGTVGKQDTWVNEVMISTVRGNDKAFKGATIKPSGAIKCDDPDNWQDYTAASQYKIALPAAGVWQISIAPGDNQILFLQVEGDQPEVKELVDIVLNESEIVVNGQEREPTAAEQPADEAAGTAAGTGQPWDNQFFIVANREFKTGEKVTLKFKYKASREAKTTTQLHGAPGAYVYWNAIGDVTFTEEWQDFEKTWEISAGDNGVEITCQSIAFNMAEIKEACKYELKDFQWYLSSDDDPEGKTLENLINETGTENFYVKEGAGTAPYQFDPTAINGVVVNKSAASSAIYNIAGQRVSKSYKGIVVKDGKKYLVK